jgi:hypothetical protein
MRRATKAAVALLAAALLPPGVAAPQNRAPIVLNPDGAWCWFQDERALVYDRKLSVASVDRSGDVQVTTWDFAKGALGIATLHPNFERDDHDTAGLLYREDQHLMAFYTHHDGPGGRRQMFYRVTRRPNDAGEWEPERSFDAGVHDGFTYANPFQLREERGRIYLFWRALDFNPTWTSSDDNGVTWRPGANHIYWKKNERPYVKYASNGTGTIHFAFTEAHPDRPLRTSLYHAFYRAGNLYRSDGSFVRRLADGPVRPEEATRIYDGNAETGKAWVWDLHLDKSGRPVVVYSTHVSPTDHRYRYARWTGSGWEDHQIAFAGKRLYAKEAYYSGGICLDPDAVGVVYLSSDVRIETGRPNASGHYEIYRGTTADGGKTWRWTALTADSRQDNLRPIVPARHPAGTFVLWFRGTYRSYVDWDTEVVAYTDANVRRPAAR